ncbi:hypothetical protein M8C21_011919, partial [Ambrosia artemisiifolia]
MSFMLWRVENRFQVTSKQITNANGLSIKCAKLKNWYTNYDEAITWLLALHDVRLESLKDV